MNKSQLVELIAKETKSSKSDALKHLEATLGVIGKSLKKGDKVALTGFGTFEVRARAARKARNPQTGETLEISASKAPAFKPGKGLKELVNGSK